MKRIVRLAAMIVVAICIVALAQAEEPARMTVDDAMRYVQEVLVKHAVRHEEWGKPEVKVRIAPETVTHREGFRIEQKGGGIEIVGGGYGGAVYGAQELGRLLERHEQMPKDLKVEDRPDFPIRGATIYFMSPGYLSPIPDYFHDRELMLEYIEYIHRNRFNTLFIWAGNLFADIMELPEYPDATDLTPEQVMKNQEQFRWLTNECARRNIDVLVHFYNILIPRALAKSRDIPHAYSAPNEFVSKYCGYVLEKFMREFNSVGLYICPGEALHKEHQQEWFRDVIFAAAKRSGQNPLLVVRSWSSSSELLESCRKDYDRVYTERKHNDELIMSPFADWRNKGMLDKGLKHICNMHLMADVKPFRWGSWRYIHDIVNDWKTIGLSGGEIQHLVNWPLYGETAPWAGSWPYSMDKLAPGQALGARQGPKLKIFERDWIWYDAFGRYMWRVDRDPETEQAYWRERLREKFGSREAAEALDAWYRVSGPILPNLKNLTLPIGGYSTTATGNRTTMNGLVKDLGWSWIRPLDPVAFARYREKYGMEEPFLSEPEARPQEHADIPYPTRVFYYVKKKLAGDDLSHYVTPEKLTALLVDMAEESVELAKHAQQAATKNKEEAARFVSDGEAILLVAKVYQHRIKAAIAKRMILDTGDKDKYAGEFVKEMEAAVTDYEQLRDLTARTYVFCSELKPQELNWDYGLEDLRKEREEQIQWLETFQIGGDEG